MAKKGLIGVQMSTIAPAKMPNFDAYESMARLTDIGYHCIELSQMPMTPENVAGIRRAVDELGMNVSSCSASVAPMIPGMPGEYLCDPDGFKKMVDDCRKLDCDMLRIGMLPMTHMGSYDKAVEFAKQANEYALKLKEEGIDLYYHNHHVEFVRYDGKLLLDIIRDTAPDMGFELDVHWIHRGGFDPVKIINNYAGRIRLLHLKDYRIGEMPMPEGGLDITNKEAMAKFMGAFTGIVQFAEVGEGTIDTPACIEAGLAGGSEYFLVEQDDCYGRDPFDSLKISRDNLVKMGYGDWF
ncbi:MAG: sugar phosphate isomerase/epimerase [Lachnospiraceae bacterium]|nr:sugar phosphate isomerase/epimerase [Lachnospiraceae bacterium]